MLVCVCLSGCACARPSVLWFVGVFVCGVPPCVFVSLCARPAVRVAWLCVHVCVNCVCVRLRVAVVGVPVGMCVVGCVCVCVVCGWFARLCVVMVCVVVVVSAGVVFACRVWLLWLW